MGGLCYAPALLLLVLVAHLMSSEVATLLSARHEDLPAASHVEVAIMAVQQNLPLSECRPKCRVRCSKAGERKRCMRYCRICCKKCRCVPPSTFGNKQDCPCYANLKNAKGSSKCP